MELCLKEEEPNHSPKLIELSIPFVEDWYAFMDESWERNKFIGCKLALKSLKYGGLNDLQKKLRESLVSNTMVAYFERKLIEHDISVEDIIDVGFVELSPEHKYKCEIEDWSHRPSQIVMKDTEKSFLDPECTMGEGWRDVDIDAYFGDTTNARISREAKQQEKSVKMSVKNNAEELSIKEHLSKIKFNAVFGETKIISLQI